MTSERYLPTVVVSFIHSLEEKEKRKGKKEVQGEKVENTTHQRFLEKSKKS